MCNNVGKEKGRENKTGTVSAALFVVATTVRTVVVLLCFSWLASAV